jgi:pimeloyl-ACP methyl ester carboxylesterase
VLRQLGPEAYLTDGTLRAVPPGWLAQRPGWLARSRSERLRAFAGEATELARIDAVVAHDLRAQLPKVTRDVSIVVARDDQITPPHLSRDLQQLLSGSQLTELATGGHFAPLTQPDSYNQFLLSTLGD